VARRPRDADRNASNDHIADVVRPAAALGAAFVPADGPMILVTLFTLGFGWNLSFVGGSALLTHGLPLAARARLQGRTDAIVWSTSALASTGSGLVVALAGYEILAVACAAFVAVPVTIALSQRSSLAVPQPAT
jgi:hypothetical protein